MEDEFEHLMIEDGSINRSDAPKVNNDGGNEIAEIESGEDVPYDTEEVKEVVEDDGYKVVKGVQAANEYEAGYNIRTMHISFVQLALVAAHMVRKRLLPWWFLLDSCPMTHIFSNAELVENIQIAMEAIRMHSSRGVCLTTQEANLSDIVTVYYDKNTIANILSFAQVQKHHRITYDDKEDVFTVHLPSRQLHFHRGKKEVYYFDCCTGKREVTLLQTLE